MRPLFGSTLEAHALAPFVGTGVLWTAFGLGSYLGLPGRAAAAAVLAALVVWRSALGVRRLPPLNWPTLGLAAVTAAGAGLVMTPLAVGGGMNVFNDATQYIAVADHLQDTPLGPPVDPDLSRPWSATVRLFQVLGHRMGATFFHSLVTAGVGVVAPNRMATDTYPAIVAWGVCLNVLAIFLAVRWVFRVPRAAALGGAGLAAVLFNPLHTAATFGFMHQLYGTAGMLATAAVDVRTTAGRRGGLVGLTASLWFAVYNEMAPLVAFGPGRVGRRPALAGLADRPSRRGPACGWRCGHQPGSASAPAAIARAGPAAPS